MILKATTIGLVLLGASVASALSSSATPPPPKDVSGYEFQGQLGRRAEDGSFVPLLPHAIAIGWGESGCEAENQEPENMVFYPDGSFSLAISVRFTNVITLDSNGSVLDSSPVIMRWPCYRFQVRGCDDVIVQFGPKPPEERIELNCPDLKPLSSGMLDYYVVTPPPSAVTALVHCGTIRERPWPGTKTSIDHRSLISLTARLAEPSVSRQALRSSPWDTSSALTLSAYSRCSGASYRSPPGASTSATSARYSEALCLGGPFASSTREARCPKRLANRRMPPPPSAVTALARGPASGRADWRGR
jgi:hypothetical protein